MSVDPRDVRQFGHYYPDDVNDYEPLTRYFMINNKRYDITRFLNEYNMIFVDDEGNEQNATDNGKVDKNGRVLFSVNINGVETDVVIKEEQTKPVGMAAAARRFVHQKGNKFLPRRGRGGRKKSRKSRKGRKGKKSRKKRRRTKRR